MRGLANECGSRNSFGYYDASAKEIILKRPCLKKQDLEEAYPVSYTHLKAGLAAADSGGAGKRPGCRWCGRSRSGKEKGNEAKPEYAPGLSRY